jgi:hypothetical protein
MIDPRAAILFRAVIDRALVESRCDPARRVHRRNTLNPCGGCANSSRLPAISTSGSVVK